MDTPFVYTALSPGRGVFCQTLIRCSGVSAAAKKQITFFDAKDDVVHAESQSTTKMGFDLELFPLNTSSGTMRGYWRNRTWRKPWHHLQNEALRLTLTRSAP